MSTMQRLPGLDAVRFYAASAVILFHLAPLSGLTLPAELGFIAQYFGFAVPLFYIASALSLMLRYSETVFDSQQLRDFYLRRFFRIAPLFYVLLVVHLAMRQFLFNAPTGVDQVLASVLFVFNFIPTYVEGLVWASWSIGVEMTFYLLFPLIVSLVRSVRSALLLFAGTGIVKFIWLGATADVAGLEKFSGLFFLPHMNYFAAGTLLFFLLKQAIDTRPATQLLVVLASACGLVIVGAMNSQVHGMFYGVSGGSYAGAATQMVWTVALCLFVLGISIDKNRVLSPPAFCRMGEVSFSTYLWHPVIIYGLARIGWYDLLAGLLEGDFVVYVAAGISTIVLTTCVATISYRFIELPGMRLGRRLHLDHKIVLKRSAEI